LDLLTVGLLSGNYWSLHRRRANNSHSTAAQCYQWSKLFLAISRHYYLWV